jgi:hypothetical protein
MNALDFVLPAAIGISTVIAFRVAEKRKKKAEFRQLLTADSNQQLAESLSTENVPPILRVLIPYAKKYSIADDLLRVQFGNGLSNKEKRELTNIVSPLFPDINNFLDSFGEDPLSDEAIVIGNLAEFVCELSLQEPLIHTTSKS